MVLMSPARAAAKKAACLSKIFFVSVIRYLEFQNQLQPFAACTVPFSIRLTVRQTRFFHSILDVCQRELSASHPCKSRIPQIRNLSINFAGEHNLPGRISSSALPCLRPVPLLENRQENKRPGAVCGERPSCPKGTGKDPVFGSCKGKAAVPRTGAGSPSISTATFFFLSILVLTRQTSRHGTPRRYHYDPQGTLG